MRLHWVLVKFRIQARMRVPSAVRSLVEIMILNSLKWMTLTFFSILDTIKLRVCSAWSSVYYLFLSSDSRIFYWRGSSLKIFFPAATPLAERLIFLSVSRPWDICGGPVKFIGANSSSLLLGLGGLEWEVPNATFCCYYVCWTATTYSIYMHSIIIYLVYLKH